MTDTATKIEEFTQREGEALRELDAISKLFVKATAAQMRAVFLAMAKEVGESQQTATLDLGRSGMIAMIDEIVRATEGLDGICHELMYQDSVWLHLNWPKEHKYPSDGRGLNPIGNFPNQDARFHLGHPINDCLDVLGNIMAKYGFSTDEKHSWNSERKVSHSKVYKAFKWSADMRKIYEQYQTKEKELWAVVREREKLEEQLPFEETDRLWDELIK